MDLLAHHQRDGRRFEPVEFIEEGKRIAVRLAVSTSERSREAFKVFTFRDGDPGAAVVLFQDCADEENARPLLSRS